MLCPKHIGHESSGDEFLRRMVRQLDVACQRNMVTRQCSVSYTGAVLSTDSELLREFIIHPSMFCGRNDYEVKPIIRRIFQTAYRILNIKAFFWRENK